MHHCHNADPIDRCVRERERGTSRLESQPKLPPLSLLADLIQEPGDSLLLRQPSTVEMLANRQCELIFAHTVLTDNTVESIPSVEDCIAVIPIVILPVVVVERRRSLHSGGGGETVRVLGRQLGSLGSD